MVITKNLTLAQAWGILDLARTNSSGNVTAFPFFATSEFYTLGFVDEVNSLVANTSVVNGGNTSVAPPPTSWQLFWNTIAGLASGPWNPWLAVGAFFTNLGKWLVQAFIAYVKGLATGNWTDFQENVVKPFRQALEAFFAWIYAFAKAVLDRMLGPLIDPLIPDFRAYRGTIVSASTIMANKIVAGASPVSAGRMLGSLVLSPIFFELLTVLLVVLAVLAVLEFLSTIAAFIAGLVVSLVVLYIAERLTGGLPPLGAPPPPPIGLPTSPSSFARSTSLWVTSNGKAAGVYTDIGVLTGTAWALALVSALVGAGLAAAVEAVEKDPVTSRAFLAAVFAAGGVLTWLTVGLGLFLGGSPETKALGVGLGAYTFIWDIVMAAAALEAWSPPPLGFIALVAVFFILDLSALALIFASLPEG